MSNPKTANNAIVAITSAQAMLVQFYSAELAAADQREQSLKSMVESLQRGLAEIPVQYDVKPLQARVAELEKLLLYVRTVVASLDGEDFRGPLGAALLGLRDAMDELEPAGDAPRPG